MADVTVTEARGFGLASVLARAGADALGAALGFAVGRGPVTSAGESLALWGTGPGQWLAHTPDAAPDWAERLGETLADLAAVVDQSSAYVLLTIAGADARRLLQKGLPVDLAALAPGAVVVSTIAHLGVIVHQAAPDRYDLAVFRSFAGSMREWLDVSIASL